MTKPLIHIGLPKTGTSWFQTNFLSKIKNRIYIDKQDINDYIIYPYVYQFKKNKIKDYFFNKYKGDIIISNEELIGAIRRGGLNGFLTKEVAIRLHKIFPDAQIVLFLRNQFDIIASSYLQYIRAGGNYSIKHFLYGKNEDNFQKQFSFSFNYFKYDEIIRLYEQLFGKENIHVYLYEDFNKDPVLFIKNFIKKFELEIDIEKVSFVKRNQRYRKGLIVFIKGANFFRIGNTHYKRLICNIPVINRYFHTISDKLNTFRIFGNRMETLKILRTIDYNYIKEYYKNSNNNLINRFDLNILKSYNYTI